MFLERGGGVGGESGVGQGWAGVGCTLGKKLIFKNVFCLKSVRA